MLHVSGKKKKSVLLLMYYLLSAPQLVGVMSSVQAALPRIYAWEGPLDMQERSSLCWESKQDVTLNGHTPTVNMTIKFLPHTMSNMGQHPFTVHRWSLKQTIARVLFGYSNTRHPPPGHKTKR